jgi:hypothetical protein
MVKAFLGSKKVKGNGKTVSHEHIHKHKNAILLRGAQQVKSHLPTRFCSENEKFLRSFKKDTRQARAEEKLYENQADLIPCNILSFT